MVHVVRIVVIILSAGKEILLPIPPNVDQNGIPNALRTVLSV